MTVARGYASEMNYSGKYSEQYRQAAVDSSFEAKERAITLQFEIDSIKLNDDIASVEKTIEDAKIGKINIDAEGLKKSKSSIRSS